jgi:hypothetical protein
MPCHFRFHLIYLFLVDNFHSPICFNSLVDKPLVFNFDLLSFIFCKLDLCVVEPCVTMRPNYLHRKRWFKGPGYHTA